MTEKPIIMSAESIRAILAGEKTQTRRVMKPQPPSLTSHYEDGLFVIEGSQLGVIRRSLYTVGAHLWVKETWTPAHGEPRWSSLLFMPKARARLWLTVTVVRAEKLQDITPVDIVAEGIEHSPAEPTLWFSTHWDTLNAKRGYGWDTNPWVWVIEFRRIEP